MMEFWVCLPLHWFSMPILEDPTQIDSFDSKQLASSRFDPCRRGGSIRTLHGFGNDVTSDRMGTGGRRFVHTSYPGTRSGG